MHGRVAACLLRLHSHTFSSILFATLCAWILIAVEMVIFKSITFFVAVYWGWMRDGHFFHFSLDKKWIIQQASRARTIPDYHQKYERENGRIFNISQWNFQYFEPWKNWQLKLPTHLRDSQKSFYLACLNVIGDNDLSLVWVSKLHLHFLGLRKTWYLRQPVIVPKLTQKLHKQHK